MPAFVDLKRRADSDLHERAGHMEQLFAVSCRFAEKDEAMARTQEWSRMNLTAVTSGVLSLADMRRKVRADIDDQITSVQALIRDSVDEAEKRMEALVDVPGLSDDVWEHAKQGLCLLQEAIRLRKEDVVQELSEATSLFAFKPVRKYLMPSNAADPHQVEQCKCRLQTLAAVVTTVIADARSSLKTCPQQFLASFDKLDRAKEDDSWGN